MKCFYENKKINIFIFTFDLENNKDQINIFWKVSAYNRKMSQTNFFTSAWIKVSKWTLNCVFWIN